MMHAALQIGVKVRLLTDTGWDAPGTVMARVGQSRVRVYWPDGNRFTEERAADLLVYHDGCSQPDEIAA